MDNCFVTGLNRAQVKLLAEAKVDMCEMEIGEKTGLVLDQANMKKAMKALEMGFVEGAETEIPGIVEVTLTKSLADEPTPTDAASKRKKKAEKSAADCKVSTTNWRGEGASKFVAIAREILLPIVKTDIIMSVPHGDAQSVVDDDDFHIFIWPVFKGGGDRSIRTPRAIWDIPTSCTDESTKPSGEGVLFKDDETKYVVAELINGNNLFIFHDICHHGNENEWAIFHELCERVACELDSGTPEEAEKRRQERREKQRVQSRQAYIEECKDRFESNAKNVQRAIDIGRAKMTELQQALVATIRDLKDAERRILDHAKAKSEHEEFCGREFDSLMEVPGVLNVVVKKGEIHVFTEHIYITPDGLKTTYDIGKFRMEISTSCRGGGIKFFNLTRKSKGDNYNQHHPHVNCEGSPCLGNISESVAQLVANYEYSALVQLGLQFLKSVNMGDKAGAMINEYWPKVRKSTKSKDEESTEKEE